MYGHEPLIRHLQTWCRDNLSKGSPGRHALHEAWGRHFDAKLAEMEAEHDNAGLFGMSGAAGCLRANALRRARVQGEPIGGDDLVTFEIGHALESFALAVLEASGFTLSGACHGCGEIVPLGANGHARTEYGRGEFAEMVQCGPTSSQIPATIPGVMCSAADGALTAGPVDLPYPVLVSVKTASYKQGGKGKRRGFAALPLDGIAAEHPTWSAQAQLEMIALPEYKNVLFLVIAKDMIKAYEGDPLLPSLSWYAELLPGSPETVTTILNGHKVVLIEEARALQETGAYDPLTVPPITFWPNGNGFKGIRLPDPGNVKDGWKGENQDATGRYNPCFSCSYSVLCRARKET